MITTDEYNALSKINKIAKITLDFYSDNYNWVSSKQLDNARYIEVTLTENGILRPVTNEEKVRVRIAKPDNKIIFNDCETIEGGKVLVELTSNMLASSGSAKMDILLTNISSHESSDYLYSTKIGIVNISPTACSCDKIESSDEFKSLTTILIEEGKRIQDLKDLDKLLTDNESTRQENELGRIASENKRQEDTAEAIANTEKATDDAIKATNDANTATNNTISAIQEANDATVFANQAADKLNSIMDRYHFVIVSDTEPDLSVNDEWLLEY